MSKPTAWLATGRERLFVIEPARSKSTRDGSRESLLHQNQMLKPHEIHFVGHVNQKALIYKDGKILLIQYPQGDKKVSGKWDMPGGRLNEGEVVIEGLHREVLEEIGVEIVVEKILVTGLYKYLSGTQKAFFVIYQASLVDENKPFIFEEAEVGDARWFETKEFFTLPIVYPEY